MHRCFQHEIYTDYVSLSSSYQYFALALWMDLSAGSDQLYLYDHTVLGKFSGRTKDKKGGKINADICDPDRVYTVDNPDEWLAASQSFYDEAEEKYGWSDGLVDTVKNIIGQ